MKEEPIDIPEMCERWWIMLAQIDHFLETGAPDEAAARANVLREETSAFFARRPDLCRGELDELRSAARFALHRTRRARREWREEIRRRHASFQRRNAEVTSYFPPPESAE